MAKKKPLKKYQAQNSEVGVIDKAKSTLKKIATAPAPTGNVKFNLTGGNPFGPGANTPYIVDTTGLAAGKQSFPMRYAAGVPAAGKKVGYMTPETVREILSRNKQEGKKAGGAVTAMDKVDKMYKAKYKKK